MMRRAALGEIAEFINGRAFKPSEWSNKGTPIIRIQNLTGTNEAFNHFDGPVEERIRVRRGDILISWSASLGVYSWQGPDAILNQHIFRVHLNNRIDRRFFYYAATSALQEMISHVHGSTMQHITKDKFEAIHVPLPSEEKQKCIAAILERADRLRRLRSYEIALAETLLPTAFARLMSHAELRQEKWPTRELGDLCTEVIDCPHSTPNYLAQRTPHPCVRSSDIQNGYLDFSEAKYVDANEYKTRIARGAPRPGDVIYCREGARFGNAARVLDGVKLCLGQRMMLFRLDEQMAASEFVWGFLSSDEGYRQATRALDGSASPHVNIREIVAFRVAVPPLPVQTRFVDLVRRYDRLRAVHRESLRQAEHLFQTLLHRAFTSGL